MTDYFREAEIPAGFTKGRARPARGGPVFQAIPQDGAPPLIDAFKAARLAELATLRWEKTQTFDYDGETGVPADPALSIITTMAVGNLLAPSSVPRSFKLKSPGTFRDWTIEQIVTYGQAAGAYVQACFDREKVLTAEINAAEDVADVRAVSINTGWPT